MKPPYIDLFGSAKTSQQPITYPGENAEGGGKPDGDSRHEEVLLAPVVGGAVDGEHQDGGDPRLDQHAAPRLDLRVDHRRGETLTAGSRRHAAGITATMTPP